MGDFFDNLSRMKRYRLTSECIYNVDETGLTTTVHTPPKILAMTGVRQVEQVTSAERGIKLTMCGAVNALGNAIPILLIFPRVNFQDIMRKGAPPGSKGVVYPSGWVTCDHFDKWMQHFIHHNHCSTESATVDGQPQKSCDDQFAELG